MLLGIPEGTIAEYIKLSSDFYIAQRKHTSMDRQYQELGLGTQAEDSRSRYYTSPYSTLSTEGFVRKENLGPRLTLDEVSLSGEIYTILGNPLENKIVALIPGIKSKEVRAAIAKEIPYADRITVREVTLDMSRSMDTIATELFPQAKRTLDRFHVTKNVLEDIQAIRVRIKTAIKDEELLQEDICRQERRRYQPKRLANSETRLDCLSRLHYQLFKRRKDWNTHQERRWVVLLRHEEFSQLCVAYTLLESFYEIYDAHISKDEARPLWHAWFRRLSQYETIKELQNTGRMVRNHLEGILHYFDARSTNAFAEGLHSRIHRLISNVRGFKDANYMLYRIMKVFS